MNVIQFPRLSWEEMIAKSESYAPLVARLVGYYMLTDRRNDEGDADPCGTLAIQAVPGLAELSADEQDFVLAGASAVYYVEDATGCIRESYRDWISVGAPQ